MSKNIIEKKYFKSGSLKSITYFNEEGQKHRKNGPAYLAYYLNGVLRNSKYFKNGKAHRKNGPSETYYNKHGEKTYEEYNVDGKWHRVGDNPAIINYKNNCVVYQYYFKNNKKFRVDNLPCEISFFLNGEVKSMAFYVNDKPRESLTKPYSTEYYQSGQVEKEYYTSRGGLSLDNELPDNISFHESGQIKSEDYFINGYRCRLDSEKPSSVLYNEEGVIILARYTDNQGMPYRKDVFRNPIIFERYSSSLEINLEKTKYDIGSKGYINLKEYSKILKEYGFDENPENLTDQQIEYLKLIDY